MSRTMIVGVRLILATIGCGGASHDDNGGAAAY